MSTISSAPNLPKRFAALDGLRGIAALTVVCYHFFCAFVPGLIPGQTEHPLWIAYTPIGILFNGHFSVSIFFVLSGFVVARAAAKSGDPFYVNIPLRYLRLALPATASVIFAWVALSVIPDAAIRLSEVIPSPWLNDTFQQRMPDFFHALYDGMVGIFRKGGSHFNNALWTMKIEALGSIAIYLVYGIASGWRRKSVVVLIGFATLFSPQYLCFVLGALMADRRPQRMLGHVFPIAAFSAGILLGFPGRGFGEQLGISRMPPALTLGNPDGLIPPIAAVLILFAVLNSASLDRFLSSPIPQYLGRVSFPLYLLHVPLIYTVFAFVYVWVKATSGLFVLGLFAAFLSCSLGLASAGEACIDKPVLDGIGWARKELRWQRTAHPNVAGNRKSRF
jgi:peptidoglycan/LPS O-acetylase OafA/YrhL